MGNEDSKCQNNIKDLLCPKCPLTPIISISLDSKGKLNCEYRCPFIHFGNIPFEDILKNKENKHGKFCDRCLNSKDEHQSKNIDNNELLYCGVCQQFICLNCRLEHDKEKENHKILIQ